MDYVKQWTFYVCITVVLSVILSFLTPKNNLGKFYRLIISLFIFASFLYPLGNNGFEMPKLYKIENDFVYKDTTNSIISNAIKSQIQSVLDASNIEDIVVDCDATLDENNNATISSVQVAIPEEYDVDEVREIIFDNLSINAQVIHIGE